jgi:hypothetical protein
MTFPGVRMAPIVPDRGPEPPSSRAWIEAYKRRLAAARVRPYNRAAAAEIESQAAEFGRHWRDSGLASARNAAARRREAEVQRQVAELRRQEDFAAARAAFHLALDRERFYRSRGGRDRGAITGGR